MNTAPKLVIGHWKMNGSAALLRALARVPRWQGTGCEAALCVPHPLLRAAQLTLALTPLRWGGQDCSAEADGAFTGDVSARMLQDCGARYVILGHSERRAAHGEPVAEICKAASRCSNETGAEPEAAMAARVPACAGTSISEGGMTLVAAANPRHPSHEGDDDVHPGR